MGYPCGLTAMELSNLLGWSINRITPRLKELRDLGYVSSGSIRKCTVTGSNASVNVGHESSAQMRMF